MQNIFEKVYSKRFLLTYLGLVALLLLFYLTVSPEQQSNPPASETHSMLTVFEPPLQIPQLLAYNVDNVVFTNEALVGKWSFVFFTSANCIDCEAILKVLSNLKAGLANRAVQVVLIDTSGKQAEMLALSNSHNLNAQVIATADFESDNAALFSFFTRSRAYASHDLKQAVFLVNPKGLLAARYQAPFTSVLIRQSFIQIRSDYANKG